MTIVWQLLAGGGTGTRWMLLTMIAIASLSTATRAEAQQQPSSITLDDTPIVSGELGVRIHELVSRAEAFGFSGQVVVEVKRRIVLHAAYGFADAANRRPMTPTTGVGVASISKQITGAAILRLEQAGKLSLGDSLPTFFDRVPTDKAGITVRQLLVHRAGVRSRYKEDFDPASQELLIRGILEAPLRFQPGSEWEYSAAGYNLLAAIVERVAGTPYGDYLESAIFKPAGMSDTYLMNEHADRHAVSHSYLGWEDRGSPAEWPRNWRNFGAGDLVSTAADLHRLEQALRSGLLFGPVELDRYFAPLDRVEDGVDYGFGLFFHMDDQGRHVIEHGGDAALGFNGSFYRYPDDGILVIITSNSRTPAGQWLRHALGVGIETLAHNGDVELPPDGTLPKAEDVKRLAGTYEMPGGSMFHVLTDGVHMWIAAHGQHAVNALAGLDESGVAAATLANEKTARLLIGLAAADSTAYLRALTTEGEAHFPGYWSEWRALVEARGPLLDFELLGSIPRRKPVTTRARLQFRTGTVTMAFFWGNRGQGRLRGTFVESVAYRPAVALALARLDDRAFIAHDLFRREALPVRMNDTGDLTLTYQETRVTARRRGAVGWTPPFIGGHAELERGIQR